MTADTVEPMPRHHVVAGHRHIYGSFTGPPMSSNRLFPERFRLQAQRLPRRCDKVDQALHRPHQFGFQVGE